MKIVVAADHGGFELKELIRNYLYGRGYQIIDVGALDYKGLDGFTEYTGAAVKKIRENKDAVGIFVCGTGTLAAMSANRFKGIRAAMCHNTAYAVQAREHNDANVLCLGGRFIDLEQAKGIINAFLTSKFLGGKYQARLDALDK